MFAQQRRDFLTLAAVADLRGEHLLLMYWCSICRKARNLILLALG